MPSPRCAAQGEGEDLPILWLNGLIQEECGSAAAPALLQKKLDPSAPEPQICSERA